MLLASWPTSEWISAARAQIAIKLYHITNHIAKMIFWDVHRTAQIACYGSTQTPLQSRDSHRGLQKYIAMRTGIARCGEPICYVSQLSATKLPRPLLNLTSWLSTMTCPQSITMNEHVSKPWSCFHCVAFDTEGKEKTHQTNKAFSSLPDD